MSLALLLSRWEYLPEPQSLIAGSSDNVLAVWAHGQVEDAHGVTCEGRHFLHRGVLPHDYRIVRVAVRAHNLIVVLAEHQVTYLGPRLDRIYFLH